MFKCRLISTLRRRHAWILPPRTLSQVGHALASAIKEDNGNEAECGDPPAVRKCLPSRFGLAWKRRQRSDQRPWMNLLMLPSCAFVGEECVPPPTPCRSYAPCSLFEATVDVTGSGKPNRRGVLPTLWELVHLERVVWFGKLFTVTLDHRDPTFGDIFSATIQSRASQMFSAEDPKKNYVCVCVC